MDIIKLNRISLCIYIYIFYLIRDTYILVDPSVILLLKNNEIKNIHVTTLSLYNITYFSISLSLINTPQRVQPILTPP